MKLVESGIVETHFAKFQFLIGSMKLENKIELLKKQYPVSIPYRLNEIDRLMYLYLWHHKGFNSL